MLAASANMAAPSPVHGQRGLARADSLLLAGEIFQAESIYYREAAIHPRDPDARFALGRYLAARGRWRIGAVLMEEARYFGANADTIGKWLAPAYERLHDYKALTGMRGSPLTRAEQQRAEWLARRAPQVAGADSEWVEWVEPDSGLGAVYVLVGDDTLLARLDSRVSGLVVGVGMRGRPWLSRFPARSSATTGVAYLATRIALGTLEMTGVPVTIIPGLDQPLLGLDVMERLAPEFDPRARRILLRRSGRVTDDSTLVSVPTLRLDQLYVADAGLLLPVDAAPFRDRLREAPWILDARRGEIRFRP